MHSDAYSAGMICIVQWSISLVKLRVVLLYFRADFWEGDATKHFSVKKWVFQLKGEDNSVNEVFGKAFYRKDNSVKRSGPFSEPPL